LLPAPLSRPSKRAAQSLAVEVTEAAATIWREFRRLSFPRIVADQARFPG